MNIIFKSVEMRNFYSFGNVAQKVELDSSPLTLILGQNNDAATSEDSGFRNGVGKSSIIQALNFGLYGKSVGNKIKVSNLINKTNKKNCEVNIEFEKDGITYRIERHRNPTKLSLYIGDVDYSDVNSDEAKGEIKDTQEMIQEIIGISHDMFNQIITLTTSVESFLGMPSGKQREMIEQLLGITQLSEKATVLKDLVRDTKNSISKEEFQIQTVQQSNSGVSKTIESLFEQSQNFIESQKLKTIELQEQLNLLNSVNIDEEIANQRAADNARSHNNIETQLKNNLNFLQAQVDQFHRNQQENLERLEIKLNELSSINIQDELLKHQKLQEYFDLQKTKESSEREFKSLSDVRDKIKKDLELYQKNIDRYTEQLETTLQAKCHTCGHALSDAEHEKITQELELKIQSVLSSFELASENLHEIQDKIDSHCTIVVPERPLTFYENVHEVYEHQSKIQDVKNQIESITNTKCPYEGQIEQVQRELYDFKPQIVPPTIYDTIEEAFNHKSLLQTATSELQNLKTQKDPYRAQAEQLQKSLQKVDFEELNRLRKLLDHQDFLLKLLTNKDSFVRKQIIEQNISFLNKRLVHYNDKCSSQHQICFMNDMSVGITNKLGNDFDFDSLSRGEKCRVIIALALAFRDTFESLYGTVNILMIDEILDSGMDPSGLEACYKIIRDMGTIRSKNVFIISHREELVARSENTMIVTKENGFSSIEYSDD